jgi:hypothetical protein
MIEHVLMECMLHTAMHQKYLTVNGHLQNLPQLFLNLKQVQDMLHFLEEMGAYVKPRAE